MFTQAHQPCSQSDTIFLRSLEGSRDSKVIVSHSGRREIPGEISVKSSWWNHSCFGEPSGLFKKLTICKGYGDPLNVMIKAWSLHLVLCCHCNMTWSIWYKSSRESESYIFKLSFRMPFVRLLLPFLQDKCWSENKPYLPVFEAQGLHHTSLFWCVGMKSSLRTILALWQWVEVEDRLPNGDTGKQNKSFGWNPGKMLAASVSCGKGEETWDPSTR